MITTEALSLAGRRALVTGAARGIGRSTAMALASLGADVVVCDRLVDELAETVSEIGSLGAEVLDSVMDVRDAEAVSNLASVVEQEWGSIDIVVNNAGGGFVADTLDVSPNGRAALIAENFTQVLDVTARFVPLMDAGSIVNITSIEGHRAGPGFGIYSAMKAGVENLTRTLALELADRRIRVNAVAPDMIPTPGDAELAFDAGAMAHAQEWQMMPWPDEGSPDDVAGAVVWLCSDLSRFVTGTTVHVDGGTSAASGWRKRKGDSHYVL